MSVGTITHLAIVAAVIALPVGAMLVLCGSYVRSAIVSRRGNKVKVAKRKCRYCWFGRAQLTEQTARVEADDLVTVRCWVCSSCGLPHWTVTRSPVVKPAKTRE
jgi:hypothetical protein